MRKQPQDHVSRNEMREVGLARISTTKGFAACSCGWEKNHPRTKVYVDAAQRHVDKKHGGRALWV